MSSNSSAVLASVNAVLESTSQDDESGALESLVDLLANDGQDWWTAVDSQEGLCEKLLVYVIFKTYVSASLLDSVFKPPMLPVVESIPALTRTGELEVANRRLTVQLQRIQWSPGSLRTLSSIIQQLEDPRVRQETIELAYRAVTNGPGRVTADDWSREATHTLVLGVTDVWSAVRKASARTIVESVLAFPTIAHIDSFVSTLLQIASGDDWKAQEGALLALTALASAIQTTAPVPIGSGPVEPPRAADLIRGGSSGSPSAVVLYHLGDRTLPQLPRSLTLKLKPTLYTSLKNSQLSVREAAAQCLVHYMDICDETTRILTFQEVMSKLNRLTSEQTADHVTPPNVELLDAAEAEGLLDVLARLVPQLPVAFLVKHWKVVYPTLERYVVHIASTVRLRGSAVVLALAQVTLVEATSTQPIELLYQMLLALAESRLDVGVCWQRLEGRLLSVDLLVGLLGKDRLWRIGPQQDLLQFVSRSRTARSSVSLDAWLPDAMIPQATWTLDEDDETRFRRASGSAESIIVRLNALAETKKVSPSELWRRVLHGWILQTREAFDSSQFELRRIARQVLPGLVRLCIWCEQLQLVNAEKASRIADAKTPVASSQFVDAWHWTCLRHAGLHTQFVQESSGLLSMHEQELFAQCRFYITKALKHEPMNPATSSVEAEAIVARVEAVLFTSLSQHDLELLPFVACAFQDIHHSLPASFQHPLVSDDTSSSSSARDGSSLDRQFSIALVLLLPALVTRTISTSKDLVLWRITERVVLSWLATDDMFRWITIEKHTAQSSLLLTLDELLASCHADTAMSSDEVVFIVRTLEPAIPLGTSSHQWLKDAIFHPLVRVYTSLWKYAIATRASTRVQGKIVTSLALLHYQRWHAAPPSKSAKSEWDDWDGDDADDAPTDAKNQQLRPTSSPSEDSGAVDSLVGAVMSRRLSHQQIETMAEVLLRLVTSDAPPIRSHHDAIRSLSESIRNRFQQLRSEGTKLNTRM